MKGFVEIVPGVFYLAPPIPEFGGGVTLVRGVNNFLIDCGAFDYSVSKFIVPALKAIKMDIKDIDYLLFTHCAHDNIGGVHKLKQLNPDIKIMYFGYQADRLKNPSYFFMEKWSRFLDDSPPFREIKGILPNGAVDKDNRIFVDLQPISAQGHDIDCVCWHHIPTNTLICGDAIQGDGTNETGIAFITSLQLYKSTLSFLMEVAPENIICSKDFKLIPSVIKGADKCMEALEASNEKVSYYAAFIDRYSKFTKIKKENLSVEEVVKAYFENKNAPVRYGYAMRTFSEFLKAKH